MSSCSSLSSFHCRVLSTCHLRVDISSNARDVQRALDSLDRFPTCGAFDLQGAGWTNLTDCQLHALLHLSAVMSCSSLSVHGFARCGEDKLLVDGEPLQAEVRVTRSKRKYNADLRKHKLFDWADVHLPAVTHLRLTLHGYPDYIGGAAFITAHLALLELQVSTAVVSVEQLTAIFHDSAALPQLTRFGLYRSEYARAEQAYDPTPLLTALATTAVGTTGGPRPVEWLSLDINVDASSRLFAAAALLPSLVRLHLSRAGSRWLRQWTSTPAMMTAFPLLQQFIVDDSDRDYRAAAVVAPFVATATDILSLLQTMAARPLHVLSIRTGVLVPFDATAMAQLARCHQLRELDLSIGKHDRTSWMDWRDAALFAPLVPAGCLSCLLSLKLHNVKVSAETVAAIASAAPQLRVFSVRNAKVSCRHAVLCAIVGGYCEHIEELRIEDNQSHTWSDVQAADVMAAYQSAVAAAGRRSDYLPFLRLRHLFLWMYSSTSSSVWHAVLRLMSRAARLHSVVHLTGHDPLVVCALSHLPSLTALALTATGHLRSAPSSSRDRREPAATDTWYRRR